MKCPSCGANVADDAAVCPKCDHILDPSLFSDEPPPSAPKKASTKAAGTKPVKRTATGTGTTKKVAANPAAPKKEAPVRRMMPEAPGRRIKPAPDPKAEDWHVEKSDRVAVQPKFESQVLDPEVAMADARNFLVSLSFSDRIAFWGGVATILACFLPFRETVDDGDSLGLLSLGALVAVANIVLVTAISIRVTKAMPRLNALVPWLMQFGGAAFSIVWCLVLIKLAVNTQKARALYGNEEVWTSKPGIGVLLALLTSIAAFAGTLMGLREKPD